jgi:hypothetical protein
MRIVRITLEGHLTREKLEKSLETVDGEGRIDLLVDCLTMTSYDADARSLFVEWHRKNDDRIGRTAIVMNNPLWKLVIATMRLAARVPMQSFPNASEALGWLERRQ